MESKGVWEKLATYRLHRFARILLALAAVLCVVNYKLNGVAEIFIPAELWPVFVFVGMLLLEDLWIMLVNYKLKRGNKGVMTEE